VPVKIPASQIQNLQQIEAVVSGPDDANRLFIIDGQFDVAMPPSPQDIQTPKETFAVLVGPVFARKQFFQANAMASFTKTGDPSSGQWQIFDVDADWDDESGQVELRIEAQAKSSEAGAALNSGFAFHVTILAAVPAA
jgi:hypothetical protein